jgi:hypothetical protein
MQLCAYKQDEEYQKKYKSCTNWKPLPLHWLQADIDAAEHPCSNKKMIRFCECEVKVVKRLESIDNLNYILNMDFSNIFYLLTKTEAYAIARAKS